MQLTDRQLNRALLARQGLLEPLDAAVPEVVAAVGPLQAQHWPSPPVALWSRMQDFSVEQLYAAFDAGTVVMGTSLRRTLHLVTAAEHPACAVVADDAGFNDWQRTSANPSAKAGELREKLRAHLEHTRTADEICAFVEEWISANPGVIGEAEQALQRQYKWRPLYTWSALLRVPADGTWSARVPRAYRAARNPPGSKSAPKSRAALAALIRWHLRAFGPAGADDVASFLGLKITPVRAALGRLASQLSRFEDEGGRTLYDVPAGPRPDPDIAAPVRFLPSFDSALLAYASKYRQRILPDEYKDAVYARANLRIKPTFLIDGMVAGLWSLESKRRVATLTVEPFARVGKALRSELRREGERLVHFMAPTASKHQVSFA